MMGFIRRRIRVVMVGLINTVRNAWLAAASVAILFVALSMAVSGLAAYRGFNIVISELEKELGVSVYLRDDASDDDVDRLRQELLDQSDRVYAVEYRSKEEALEVFKNSISQDDDRLLQATIQTGNVFPASFEVKLNNLEYSQWVVDYVGSEDYQDTVEDAKISDIQDKAIANFKAAQRAYITISAVVGIAFALVSIVVVFNTIRIAIFNRSDEVSIMKLLGAPRSYIRQPFMIEAALYGLLAAGLTIGLMLAAVRLAPDEAVVGESQSTLLGAIGSTVYESLVIEFENNKLLVISAIIFVGVGVSVITSRLALHRYLKFKNW